MAPSVIRALTEETGAKIDVQDDGTILIATADGDAAQALHGNLTGVLRRRIAAPAEPEPAGVVQDVGQRDGEAAGRRLAGVGDAVGDDDQAAHALLR